MSRKSICPISKKTSVLGRSYSNKTRATKFTPSPKHKKNINMQTKKIFIPETGKTIKLSITTNGLRTMKKRGIQRTLKKANII